MNTTAPSRSPRARLPLSLWIVAVAVPLLVGAAAVAMQLAWLPQLPDPIAMHWGPDGPDGYGPAWSAPALTAALSLGLTALFAAFLATAREPAPTTSHKILAVVSSVTAVFLGATVTASVAVQRGLSDARDAASIDAIMGVALVSAVFVGVLAWVALPKSVSVHADATPAGALLLAPGERTVWIASTRIATGAIVAILSAIGVSLAATVFAITATAGAVWPLAVVPVLLVAAATVTTAWRVRVGPDGLVVRSLPFRWPRVRIRTTEIASVSAPHIEPLAEFGGWGWRWSPARGFGVVARSGSAIEVLRRDGRRFVVTVDDAETGAALLAAYAASATENRERGPQTGSARRNG